MLGSAGVLAYQANFLKSEYDLVKKEYLSKDKIMRDLRADKWLEVVAVSVCVSVHVCICVR